MSDDDLEGLILGRHFHEKADETNDPADHDELHAAGTVLDGDAIWAMSNPYISRWLKGLAERHGVEGEW